MLRELIQEAIGLGGCIIDAINACFTPGESLPDVFQKHILLLLECVAIAGTWRTCLLIHNLSIAH